MLSEWTLETIDNIKADVKGAIAIGPFGSRMKSKCYVESGIPVIRGTNITGGRSFKGDFVFISEKMAKTLGSSNVYQDDLVFPHRGSIGEVGIVKDSHYVLSSSLMKLTCDKTKANPEFIYYFFKSHIGKHELLKNASQVGTPGIGQPLTSLKSIKLLLPPLPEQKAIAHILGALDDKIELNRKMNETLEAMAQALFKSWFVDFDPVIDNALAAGKTIPAELQAKAEVRKKKLEEKYETLAAARQALADSIFPSEFIETEELGPIPKGWKVKTVGNLVDTISKTYPLKSVSKVIFLNTGDIKEGKFLHNSMSAASSLPGQAKKSIQKGDILYSEIRPQNKRFAFVHFDSSKYVVSTKLMVLRSKGEVDSLFTYFVLKQQDKIDYLQMMAESRSGTFPQITFDVLSKIQIVMPEANILNNFIELSLRPIFEKSLSKDKKNETLSQIRDTLLPKLLSGEIQIKDAEKLVEAWGI